MGVIVIAVHLEQILFALFIVIAFFFQLLTKAAGKSSDKSADSGESEPPATPQRRSLTGTPGDSDQERIRRFLEALGQPTSTRPPPPVVPRTDIGPRPVAPVQPPRPLDQPRRVFTPKPQPIPKAIRPERDVGDSDEWLRKKPGPAVSPPIGVEKTTSKPSEVAIFEVREVDVAKESSLREPTVPETASTADLDLFTLLSSPSGMRNAILLREILGPPRGLQSI